MKLNQQMQPLQAPPAAAAALVHSGSLTCQGQLLGLASTPFTTRDEMGSMGGVPQPRAVDTHTHTHTHTELSWLFIRLSENKANRRGAGTVSHVCGKASPVAELHPQQSGPDVLTAGEER